MTIRITTTAIPPSPCPRLALSSTSDRRPSPTPLARRWATALPDGGRTLEASATADWVFRWRETVVRLRECGGDLRGPAQAFEMVLHGSEQLASDATDEAEPLREARSDARRRFRLQRDESERVAVLSGDLVGFRAGDPPVETDDLVVPSTSFRVLGGDKCRVSRLPARD